MRHKGSAFIINREFILENSGAEALANIQAAMTEQDRQELFGKPILPVSWVDLGALLQFLAAADKIIGTGNGAMVGEGAARSAEKFSKGFYRLIISLASPEKLINGFPRAWQQLFDEGTVAIEWKSKKNCVVKISEVKQMPALHEIGISASLIRMLSLTGAKNVRFKHERCSTHGDPYCELEFEWD